MKYILLVILFSVSIFAQEKNEEKEDVNLKIPIPFYSSDTGIGLALYWKNIKYEDIYRKDNEIMALITPKGQNQIFVSNTLENMNKGINLYYGIGYTDWKSTYYGIGLNEDSKLEEDYSKLSYRAHVGIGKEISEKSLFNLTYLYSKNKIKDISEEIIKDNRDEKVMGINLGYSYNNTDSKRNPKNGYKLRISGEFYDEILGSDVNYRKNTFDIKAYKKITEKDRMVFQYVLETSTDDTPFYDLYSLGSSMMIRGFLADRYIDKNFSGIQGEYKHYLSKKWIGAIFGGFGTISEDIEEIYDGKWKLAAGIGLRYVFSEEENVKFRFDIGFNDDGGSAVYILFSEAI